MHRLKAKKKESATLTGLVGWRVVGGEIRKREKRNPVGRGPATSRRFRSADRRGKKRVAPSLRDVVKLSY